MLPIVFAVIFTAIIGLTIGLHVTILIGAFLGFFVGFCINDDSLVEGIVGGMVGIVIFALIAVTIGSFVPTHYALEEKTELVSFKDTTGIKGSFFLGSGSIESKIQYFYYKKVGNGFTAGKLSADKDNVIIYEQDGADGVILKYREQLTLSGWYKYFALSLPDCVGHVKYEVFVPKGSILHNYQLDLE